MPILSQINTVHASFNFIKIYFNIIFTSTPSPSKWSLSLWFRHQNLVCTFFFQYLLHAPPISFSLIPSLEQYLDGCTDNSSLHYLPLSFYVAPLGPRYPPQHPILKNHQPNFFTFQPKFQSTHNNRQNYNYVHPNLHIFEQPTVRSKIPDRILAGITRVQSACNFFTKAILIFESCYQIF